MNLKTDIDSAANSHWMLYVLRTETQHLYTGITTDIHRRLQQHQSGKGAKFVRGKGILTVVYNVEVGEHSLALRLEYALKQLNKSQKERLISHQPLLTELKILLLKNISA